MIIPKKGTNERKKKPKRLVSCQMYRATRRILRIPCPFPVGDLRSPKWRAARYARPFSLHRRTWVEANLFIRSFLPGGNTYRTFRAPFVKRVAGRTLTAHSNVLRIYVARFPAFPSLSPNHQAVTTFPSPSNSLLVLSPAFRQRSFNRPAWNPTLTRSLSTNPFCKETDFSTPSLTRRWVVVDFQPQRLDRQLLINPILHSPPS